MTQSKSRRSFLGNLLSSAAGAWVVLSGLALTTTGCSPAVKYGGPPPEPVKYGGPPPRPGEPGPPTAPVDTATAPFAEPPASATAAPTAEGSPEPDPGAVVVKYGGPPPAGVRKYGGPPPGTKQPKYGGFRR